MGNIDKKGRCMRKTRELGIKYVKTYVGCAQSTFAAVVDALRSEGVNLVTPEVEEEIHKGLVGLSGGVGNLSVGNCGALTAASLAISLDSNIGRMKNKQDKENRWISYFNVAEGVAKKFMRKYGGLTCREVQIGRFGKYLDLRIPEMNKEFFENAEKRGCQTPEKCTISQAAAWAVEAILDMREHPRDLERIKTEYERGHWR